jgi:hypothetical protein
MAEAPTPAEGVNPEPTDLEAQAAAVFNADAKDEPVKAAEAEGDEKTSDEPTKEKADPEKDVAKGAPEEYEKFDTPEEFDYDEAAAEAFAPVAKDLDLSQEQAQKLVDVYAEQMREQSRAQHEHFQTVQEGWQKQAREDTEYGGAKFEENVGKANAFLKKFGSDDLTTALAETGMANHPELIRLMVKAGQAMSEDGLVFGQEHQAPKDPASILFPNQDKI